MILKFTNITSAVLLVVFTFFSCKEKTSEYVAASSAKDNIFASTAQIPDNHFLGDQSCKTCHASQFKLWQGSHHDKAMQVVSDSSILGDFNNGLACVRKNNKYGYINKKNEIIIPIIYDSALPFIEKKAIVKKDGRSFIINCKGKEKKNISKPYLWLERNELIRFAE